MSRSIYVKGAALSVIGSIFWAVSGTCGQYLFESKGFEAGWLVAVRLLMAGLIMVLLSLKSQGSRTLAMWKEKKNVWQLILYGLVGMMGVQYTYFMAIYCSNAATATILQYLGPVLIMLYMVFSTRKPPALTEGIAVVCALIGMFLLVTHGNTDTLMISPAALIWGVLSAAAMAFYSIFPRRMLAEWGTLMTNGFGMLIGGIAISFIFHPWDYGNGVWDIPALLALASVVLLGTIMSFFCYLEGIRLIGSTRASLYACVEPLAATLIGIFWLHIRFDLIDWVGSAFIVSTVFILSIKTEDKKKQKGQREEALPSSEEACEEENKDGREAKETEAGQSRGGEERQ